MSSFFFSWWQLIWISDRPNRALLESELGCRFPVCTIWTVGGREEEAFSSAVELTLWSSRNNFSLASVFSSEMWRRSLNFDLTVCSFPAFFTDGESKLARDRGQSVIWRQKAHRLPSLSTSLFPGKCQHHLSKMERTVSPTQMAPHLALPAVYSTTPHLVAQVKHLALTLNPSLPSPIIQSASPVNPTVSAP